MLAPLYLTLIVIPMLLCMLASWRTKSVFAKYSRIETSRHITGAEVAQAILARNNIPDVRVERVAGFLSDHYDPNAKVLRLSPEVYSGYSMAAFGVAAHEVGHAIQHDKNYAPLKGRSGLLPIAKYGSQSGLYMIIGSLMLGGATSYVGFLLVHVSAPALYTLA